VESLDERSLLVSQGEQGREPGPGRTDQLGGMRRALGEPPLRVRVRRMVQRPGQGQEAPAEGRQAERRDSLRTETRDVPHVARCAAIQERAELSDDELLVPDHRQPRTIELARLPELTDARPAER